MAYNKISDLTQKPEVKILLYSGGMDSYLIRQLWNPDLCFYVNVESQYAVRELESLRNLGFIPDPVKVVRGAPLSRYERKDSIIPYRNIYMVLAALNEFERRCPIESSIHEQRVQICLGATKGDRVYDKSLEFVYQMSEMLSFLSLPQHWTGNKRRRVEVVIPYKDFTKKQLLSLYLKGITDDEREMRLQMAWKESLSCYNPDFATGKSCGMCKPCVRKTIAFTLNGYYNREYIKKARKYLWDNDIIGKISRGTYGRGKEEEQDIMDFVSLTN